MVYAFAIVSMLAYGMQNVLLVRHARRIDGLSLAFYRNISFAVTMLPLLAWATPGEIRSILADWPVLCLSAFGGALYLGSIFASYKSLPAGVSQSMSRAVSTVLLAAVGWVVFKETLSMQTIAVIAMTIAGTLWLALQRNPMEHISNDAFRGGLLCLASAVGLVLSTVGLMVLTRGVSVLGGAYVWEVTIGLATGALLLARRLATGENMQRIDGRTFLVIAGCSSPTVVGTGALALALSNGSVAVVTAIGSAGLLVTSLLSWRLYGERLRGGQWLAILTIATAIVLLKFV